MGGSISQNDLRTDPFLDISQTSCFTEHSLRNAKVQLPSLNRRGNEGQKGKVT